MRDLSVEELCNMSETANVIGKFPTVLGYLLYTTKPKERLAIIQMLHSEILKNPNINNIDDLFAVGAPTAGKKATITTTRRSSSTPPPPKYHIYNNGRTTLSLD